MPFRLIPTVEQLAKQWGLCEISGSGGRKKTVTLPIPYLKKFFSGNITDTGSGCFSYGIGSTNLNTVDIYVAPQYISGAGLTITGNAMCFWIIICC